MSNHQKAMDYMDGWKVGAAFMPVSDSENKSLAWMEGYDDGKAQRSKARKRAEKYSGYKFAVLTISSTPKA